MKKVDLLLNEETFVLLTLSPMGGASEAPPPSGIGDCSKTHLCIDLKLFDFSYRSKTKILKQKKIRFFYPTPLEGGTKKIKNFESWS